jgi:hypothetical protein
MHHIAEDHNLNINQNQNLKQIQQFYFDRLKVIDLQDDARVPAMNPRQFLHGLIYIHKTHSHLIILLTFISCCVSYYLFYHNNVHQNLCCKQHILTSDISFGAYSCTSYLFMMAEVLNDCTTECNNIKMCMAIHFIKIGTCSSHYCIQKQ